jgi:polyisoprenoid-binding protein YceI
MMQSKVWTPCWIVFGLFVLVSISPSAFAADHASGEKNQLLHADFTSSSGAVEFRATGHPSALHVTGKGVGATGSLNIQPDGRTVSGHLVFDLRTLDTGISLRDEHMKEKYLEASKYPEADLDLKDLKLPESISSLTPVTVPFQGVLTLHGTKKPVSGSVDLKTISPGVILSVASFAIKLPDFGIEIPKYMGITIAEDVQLTVTASALIH